MHGSKTARALTSSTRCCQLKPLNKLDDTMKERFDALVRDMLDRRSQ